jgi:hypothetical protein
MKRLLVLACVVLGGCSALHSKMEDASVPAAKPAPAEERLVGADGVPIERIPFRAGVSSVSVEKMARSQQCSGGPGAGLVTEPGPVEVYRMQCDNGKMFMARCELRQCRQM